MNDLRDRTKTFGPSVIKMHTKLPRSAESQVMGKQVLRSGTSIVLNYREACQARSNPEFTIKMGIVE